MNALEITTIILGFIIRLAVPLGITVGLAWLLQRLDTRWRAEGLQQPLTAKGVRIPLHLARCWDINNCAPTQRNACPAHQNPNMECWDVMRVNGHIQDACRRCRFRKQKVAALAA